MALLLNDCVHKFIFHCTYEKALSQKSIKAYQIDLNQFVTFTDTLGTRLRIETINKEVLKAYIALVSHKYKPKSIKRKLATLKAFLIISNSRIS